MKNRPKNLLLPVANVLPPEAVALLVGTTLDPPLGVRSIDAAIHAVMASFPQFYQTRALREAGIKTQGVIENG